MQGNIIDYFKLFKVLELKKLEKTGNVRLIQDPTIARKVIAIDGAVAANNFIAFPAVAIPNVSLTPRFLYLLLLATQGCPFSYQLSFTINSQTYRVLFSSLHKNPKRSDNSLQLPTRLAPGKWTLLVIDCHEIGSHFSLSAEQMRLGFRMSNLELRATLRAKGIFQADQLFSADHLPRDMNFPLRKEESFFQKYDYCVETLNQTKVLAQKHRKSVEKPEKIQKQSEVASKIQEKKRDRKKEEKKIGKSQERVKSKSKKLVNVKSTQCLRQDIEKFGIQEYQLEEREREMRPPQPIKTMDLILDCMQGFTLSKGGVTTLQSWITKPVVLGTHKCIVAACLLRAGLRVATAYKDGSVCIWDCVRMLPISYFKTDLTEIRILIADEQGVLVLQGLDRQRRQIISIVRENQVLFRQVSTSNIADILFLNSSSFQAGLLSFGYENIRLWHVKTESRLIQGRPVGLGQGARATRYKCGIIAYRGFVGDSSGFVTVIDLEEGRMIQAVKIEECGIDQLALCPHFPKQRKALLANQRGGLKVVDLERLQVLEQYSLSSRVRELSLGADGQIELTHYNNSLGRLDLTSGLYSFSIRSHSSKVNRLAYSPYTNSLLSISDDSTLRIWRYLPQTRLQQLYQFLINGEQLTDVVAAQSSPLAFIAGSSGKVRNLDVECFQMQNESTPQKGRVNLALSRNGQYLLASYPSANVYLFNHELTLLHRYTSNIDSPVHPPRVGFNHLNREYYMENPETKTFDFYSLKDNTTFLHRLTTQQISRVESIGARAYTLGERQLQTYERGSVKQIVAIDCGEDAALSYPFVSYCKGEKLVIQLVIGGKTVAEEVDLPEPVVSILIFPGQSPEKGTIFCAGKSSFAIYTVSYRVHNLLLTVQPIIQQFPNERDSLQISFSREAAHKTATKHLQGQEPVELRKLYAKEQQLYEQIKQLMLPTQKREPQNEAEDGDQYANTEQIQQAEGQMDVSLLFGYQIRQGVDEGVGNFTWLGQTKSLLLLSNGGRTLIQHVFAVPVKQKSAHFPTKITSLALASGGPPNVRHLVVATKNLLKLYNVRDTLSFVRTLDCLLQACPHNIIFESAITPCNSYLLTLSHSHNDPAKLFIHLIDIAYGSIVSSSYLVLPNQKSRKITRQALLYRLLINPYKATLEFVILGPAGALHFYRATSLLTLQTLQVEEMIALSRDKVAQVTCGCFLYLPDSTDAVLALGTINGSIILIDCRTASILIACISLAPPLTALAFASNPNQQQLLLFPASSPFVSAVSLEKGLNSLLQTMEKPGWSGEKMLRLDGQVTAYSNTSEGGTQMMVVSKAGTLWLLDFQDWLTIKVSSVHTATITQAELLKGSDDRTYLFSCGEDGCAKLTALQTLEQPLEIYKPRKSAKAFCLGDQFILVAFGCEVHIYGSLFSESGEVAQLTGLGSFKVGAEVIDMKQIPQTTNYYILSEEELLMAHVRMGNGEALVELQPMAEGRKGLSVQVNQHAPYDQFGLCGQGQVAVWTRKCLRRNTNPLDELATVHSLAYYLMDSHTRTAPTALYFLSPQEHLTAYLDEGIVQIRNFREHSILREIPLSIPNLTAITMNLHPDLIFILADKNGQVFVLNQNGLILEKCRALDGSIHGLHLFGSGRKAKILAYGSKFVAILTHLPYIGI